MEQYRELRGLYRARDGLLIEIRNGGKVQGLRIGVWFEKLI